MKSFIEVLFEQQYDEGTLYINHVRTYEVYNLSLKNIKDDGPTLTPLKYVLLGKVHKQCTFIYI